MAEQLELSLARIREPAHPMRENMADEALEELVQSIRELGVLQPLLVRRAEDDMFEVVAGHRRLLAARLAGLATVPVKVHDDDSTLLAARVHENLLREDVAPDEEAVFYAELYEAHGEDVDVVAGLVRRSREYVERRLLLLRGDGLVLEALRAKRINLGQAEELNRMTRAEDRAYYLEYVARAGASVRQLREWRSQANVRAELAAKEGPADAGTVAAATGASPAPANAGPLYASMAPPWEFSSSTEMRRCLFCGSEHQAFRMYQKHVCEPCANTHLVRAEQEAAKHEA
jgi:ParB family transcriptional regulator, chromosome partitioning protein